MNNELQKGEPNDEKRGIKAILMSVLGLKVYLDPTKSTSDKVVAAGRLTCCTAAVILGGVAEASPAGSRARLFFSVCCTISWACFTGLCACKGTDDPPKEIKGL